MCKSSSHWNYSHRQPSGKLGTIYVGLRAGFGQRRGGQLAERVAAGKPEMKMMSFSDWAAGQRMVETRRVAAIFYDISGVDALAKQHPQKFARGFKLPSDLVIGAAVSKKATDLQNAVHDGLRAVQAKGQQKTRIDPASFVDLSFLPK